MSHRCVLCAPGGALQVYEGGEAVYSARFAGPPSSTHGGMAVAGLLCPALRAGPEGGRVTHVVGRIRRPVPLDAPIEAKVTQGTPMFVDLVAEGETVLSGQVTLSPSLENSSVPQHLSRDVEALAAQAGVHRTGTTLIQQRRDVALSEGLQDINICYGCSEMEHAMKVRTWRLNDEGDLFSTWELEDEQVEENGMIAQGSILAALDCTNVWVITMQHANFGLEERAAGRSWLTGTHGATFLKDAPADKDYRILSRNLEIEGRKAISIAVLCDAEGVVYAVAEDILIQTTN